MRLQRLHADDRRRIVEVVLMVVIALLLVGLSRLETRLFDLSKELSDNHDFFTSIVFFGQINFNVLLILALGGLVFRNVAKLLVERRRGVIGSNLKTKLVVTLIFFAVAPTAVMFYISSRFITTSFDSWFSKKVQETMQQTREAGAKVYRQDQRRLESLARIALQQVGVEAVAPMYPGQLPEIKPAKLKDFVEEYRLDGVKIYDANARLIWSSQKGDAAFMWPEIDEESGSLKYDIVRSTIEKFQSAPSMISKGALENYDDKDVVKGMAPIWDTGRNRLLGVVVTEEHFEMQILRSIEAILTEFSNLRPGAQLIRLSYLILLVAMVLIIIFSATWLGFNVARNITGPIRSLAEATREVALGNYGVTLQALTDDETGQLVRQFNLMTKDLRKHKQSVERSQTQLREINEELERRRQYMEVVLRNINAGVLSVDADGKITSCSSAGMQLLGIDDGAIEQNVRTAFSANLMEYFWIPVERGLERQGHFSTQLELAREGADLTLIVEASRFYDETGQTLGTAVVFDDATERVKAQRVAAWREVARRIAHEIKNPITPIKLNAQRLLRRYESTFQGEDRRVFKDCVESILVQVESLKKMVNEFSRFSRMPTISATRQCMSDIIREAVSFFELSYPDIRFDLTGLAAEQPNLLVDKGQMNRAFVNLIANAVEAIKDQGGNGTVKISSSVDLRLNVLKVKIADSGAGIPKKVLNKVIEPYFTTKKEGTGLGLAIVNQTISDHGGYLRFAANSPQGTVVTIELPIEYGATHAAASSV